MLSISQALQNAKDTTSWAVGMCDNFVANMYGYTNSGYDSASVQWATMPANVKHPGDNNPPQGALVFWGGGYGHVAISDGQGGIYSTDIPSAGTVSHVAGDYPSRVWGKPYLGWSEPYFSGQADTTSGAGSPISGVTPTGSVSPAFDPLNPLGSAESDIMGAITSGMGSGFKGMITQVFAGLGTSLLKYSVWGAEMLIGLLVMGLALYLMVKETPGASYVRRGISAITTQ